MNAGFDYLSDPFYPLDMWETPIPVGVGSAANNAVSAAPAPAPAPAPVQPKPAAVTGGTLPIAVPVVGAAGGAGPASSEVPAPAPAAFPTNFNDWVHHPLLSLHAAYAAVAMNALRLHHTLFVAPHSKAAAHGTGPAVASAAAMRYPYPIHGTVSDHHRFMQSIMGGHSLLGNHSLMLDVHKRHNQYVITVDVSGVDVKDIDLRVNTKNRTMEITAVRHHDTSNDGCMCFIDLNTCHCNGHCGRAPTKTAATSNAHCSDCEKLGRTTSAGGDSKQQSVNRACCGICPRRTSGSAAAAATSAGSGGGAVTDCGSSIIRTERYYGSLFRRIKLPIDADLTKSISSTVHNGVCTIKLNRYLLPRDTDTVYGVSDTKQKSSPHELILQVRALTDSAIREAASIGADPNRRQNVLQHHITVPEHVNPSVDHAKITAGVLKAAATSAANGNGIAGSAGAGTATRDPAVVESAACAAAANAK